MSKAYTIRLGGAHLTTGGNQLLFTAPGDAAIVVRDITAVVGVVAGVAQVYVQSGSDLYPLVYVTATSAPQMLHLDLRQRLLAGDEIFVASNGPSIQTLVTGYQFDA